MNHYLKKEIGVYLDNFRREKNFLAKNCRYFAFVFKFALCENKDIFI